MLIININTEGTPELVLPRKFGADLFGDWHFSGRLNLQCLRVYAGDSGHGRTVGGGEIKDTAHIQLMSLCRVCGQILPGQPLGLLGVHPHRTVRACCGSEVLIGSLKPARIFSGGGCFGGGSGQRHGVYPQHVRALSPVGALDYSRGSSAL